MCVVGLSLSRSRRRGNGLYCVARHLIGAARLQFLSKSESRGLLALLRPVRWLQDPSDASDARGKFLEAHLKERSRSGGTHRGYKEVARDFLPARRAELASTAFCATYCRRRCETCCWQPLVVDSRWRARHESAIVGRRPALLVAVAHRPQRAEKSARGVK